MVAGSTTSRAKPMHGANQQMSLVSCTGGSLELPSKILCDRVDGGHLVVNPPRAVWERSQLTKQELEAWSVLVAASGRAMLEALPQLNGGCINYWEAGNWALNHAAPPVGPKNTQGTRRVHLHLFGRSRNAHHADWQWGESPMFPTYAESAAWSSQFVALTEAECALIASHTRTILREKYGMWDGCQRPGEIGSSASGER
jgi:diadenosine tetraphosphate (Ap4A) HIT family hydrolase